MVNGCVKGKNDCGCSCHRIPGVKHVMPCCDKPALGSKLEKPDGTEWMWVKAPEFDTDRDPGDETE